MLKKIVPYFSFPELEASTLAASSELRNCFKMAKVLFTVQLVVQNFVENGKIKQFYLPKCQFIVRKIFWISMTLYLCMIWEKIVDIWQVTSEFLSWYFLDCNSIFNSIQSLSFYYTVSTPENTDKSKNFYQKYDLTEFKVGSYVNTLFDNLAPASWANKNNSPPTTVSGCNTASS